MRTIVQFIAVLMVIGLIISVIQVIIGLAVLAAVITGVVIAVRAVRARRRASRDRLTAHYRGLISRADAEHARVLAGEPAAIYARVPARPAVAGEGQSEPLPRGGREPKRSRRLQPPRGGSFSWKWSASTEL